MKGKTFSTSACIIMFIFCIHGQGLTSEAIKEGQSYYLSSLYGDCVIFLEAIELFIERDYPEFWNVSNSDYLNKKDIISYLDEVKDLEHIILSLFLEYKDFRESNISTTHYANKLHHEITSLLALSFMKVGNLYMPTLIFNTFKINNGNSADVFCDIRNVEGNVYKKNVTEDIKTWNQIILKNIVLLKINYINFYPEDISSLDAILLIKTKNKNFLNQLCIGYFSKQFPSMAASNGHKIHFKDINRYFSHLEYIGIRNYTNDEYILPISDGVIDISINSPYIKAQMNHETNTLSFEHYCKFKSIDQESFINWRKLGSTSNEERIDIVLKKVFHENAVISPSEETFSIGSILEYGKYIAYEKINSKTEKCLGMVNLNHSTLGENSNLPQSNDQIAQIKVFNHDLILDKNDYDMINPNTCPMEIIEEQKYDAATDKISATPPPPHDPSKCFLGTVMN